MIAYAMVQPRTYRFEGKPLPSDLMPSTRARIVAMRKIDWGGAGQIPEALGQDRIGSFLSINRISFPVSLQL